MDTATWAILIAAGALALNFIDKIFGGGWNLSKNLGAVEGKVTAAVTTAVAGLEEKHKEATHDFGETVSALKEHVRQVEFHIRDNYIRKDDFIVHMKQHDDLLRMNFANINSRLDRIEKTLDEQKKP